jgi:adenine-specific DNA-methyltransferase
LSHAEALESSPRLFPTKTTNGFDIVISNPPYFKIQRADPRAKVAAIVVHGQPNIYALFMAISAALIRPGGMLITITPRSFAAGQYFRLFRARFFSIMRPEAIHLFSSRRDAFWRDEILQENVILATRRCDNWSLQSNGEMVTISSSIGINDLSGRNKRNAAMSQVLDFTSRDKVLRIPVTSEDDKTLSIVHSWPGNLHAYGLEISTGPVVPFRATSLLCQSGIVPQTHAPLLWMQNVTAMQFDWPVEAKDKAQYISINAASRPLLVAEKNYVLLRRFSAKEQRRRLTAAPLLKGRLNSPVIGIENHLNYIYRPRGSLTPEETYGLAVLFNSRLIDTYFRIYNGNTQVSATELRAMPLPPLEVIVEMGRRAMLLHNPTGIIDTLVKDALHIDDHTAITQGAVNG